MARNAGPGAKGPKSQWVPEVDGSPKAMGPERRSALVPKGDRMAGDGNGDRIGESGPAIGVLGTTGRAEGSVRAGAGSQNDLPNGGRADETDDAGAGVSASGGGAGIPAAVVGLARRARRFGVSLSAKLLGLTIIFVMLCELAVYIPSIAGFRMRWLDDALGKAAVAALILSDDKELSPAMRQRLVGVTDAQALAVIEGDRRRLLALSDEPIKVDLHVDVDTPDRIGPILDALETLTSGGSRTLRVSGPLPGSADRVEIVIPERPLFDAMIAYSQRIFTVSLIISIITAALVYWSLRRLMVRPLQRMSRAMEAFAAAPEDADHILEPTDRRDEIGDAWRRLRAMQKELARTLHQRRRLAELGLAVSKINHDLRNLLASAQLLSDRLATAADPMVQRLAPKITHTLDRAVSYTRSVMAYGAAREAPPERRVVRVSQIVAEAAEAIGLVPGGAVTFVNEVPGDLEADADPEQLFRVLVNLGRNAVQALQSAREHPGIVRRLTISGRRTGAVVHITVADTGPGVSPRAREHLFQAFQGGVRPGGVGLGLAIAAELVRAHGGSIALVGGPPGATFEIVLPDRPVDLDAVRRAVRR